MSTTLFFEQYLALDQVYKSGQVGGALIVDKFLKEGVGSETNEKPGQHHIVVLVVLVVREAECTV